jgi:hypothetical protein
LQSVFGKTFLHVPGQAGKFALLLPWPALNQILETHRLEPPRLRLTREGKPVPPETYLSWQTSRRWPSAPRIPRVQTAAFTRWLREGATLVLDAVDELHPPVRTLASELERVFRVRVQVNAYAGWRTSHGFDLHWDDHDVFILQVEGRKRWQVYGVTRPHPLRDDPQPAPRPHGPPMWEATLEPGHLLYLPRGWWHVALPLNEPTLHLTVGIHNPTGADFLAWFVRRLRSREPFRQDIPHWQGSDAVAAWEQQLSQDLLAALQPGLIQEFLAASDAQARPRPAFSLPWSATPDVVPHGDYAVRWLIQRPLSIRQASPEEIHIDAAGRRWKFAPQARPILQSLLSGRIHRRSELLSLMPEVEPALVDDLVRQLIAEGLLALC